MKPFFITVGARLSLLVVPETEAHFNGHPVITYTYSLFIKNRDEYAHTVIVEDVLKVDKQKHPDYMGSIVFEQPDKLFDYIPDGAKTLDGSMVQEIIERITEFRDKPKMWSF